jgi:glucan 1,4-alpha-glucosidase
MRNICLLLCLALGFITNAQVQYYMHSPNGQLKFNIIKVPNAIAQYNLLYKGQPIVLNSNLAFTIKGMESLGGNYNITAIDSAAVNQTWQPVLGEQRDIVNNYKSIIITFTSTTAKPISWQVECRVFNDGIGFRYLFAKQDNLHHFILSNEKTQFKLTQDYTAFWLPGDYDTNEYNPTESKLSQAYPTADQAIHAQTKIPGQAVQTPLMLKDKNRYINIHEAALINYPAMNLEVTNKGKNLTSHLVPDAVGNAAYLIAPCSSPWRTVLISDKATDILASRTILNLNEPCAIKDVSFIKPMKYVGIWWEMHVGKSTWDYSATQNMDTWENLKNAKPHGKHGATTENTKRYIDFAAKHGFGGVLIEGWNVGWEDWFGKWKEDVFDFVTPYPDFDVAELNRYAASKNVQLIMHHETSGSATNYERYMDTAYKFMNNFGYPAVKTGYVGKIIPRGEHHDGQWMVNHYRRSVTKTAEKKIMINMHEPVRPTGWHRTYPNLLACEAARGMEFNAWSDGNKPEHETIFPFTRLMGGPMDYTPGIFRMTLNYADPSKKEIIHTTLAKQLALYVTMYSPLQMAADFPEHYEAKMDAFQFIKDVAADWDNSYYLEAEPGEYITIARKAKNENKWFVGAITDEKSRTATVNLSFLPAGTYTATVYYDKPDAHYEKNMEAYQIKQMVVTNKQTIQVPLAPGGGCAISIMPAASGKASTQKIIMLK